MHAQGGRHIATGVWGQLPPISAPQKSNKHHFNSYYFMICLVTYAAARQNLPPPKKKLLTKNCGLLSAIKRDSLKNTIHC